MKFEANKLIEGWIDIRELAMIPEEEEPSDEPTDEPTDKPPEMRDKLEDSGLEQKAPKTNNLEPGPRENDHRCKVKTLTDYFDRLGGHKAPRTPNKTTKTPSRDIKSGGVKSLSQYF